MIFEFFFYLLLIFFNLFNFVTVKSPSIVWTRFFFFFLYFLAVKEKSYLGKVLKFQKWPIERERVRLFLCYCVDFYLENQLYIYHTFLLPVPGLVNIILENDFRVFNYFSWITKKERGIWFKKRRSFYIYIYIWSWIVVAGECSMQQLIWHRDRPMWTLHKSMVREHGSCISVAVLARCSGPSFFLSFLISALFVGVSEI